MSSAPHALIVEDLDFWQDALKEVLVDAGYRVRTASSYAEALSTLAENEFQLVVIDPVLDDANRRNRDGLRVLSHVLDRKPDVCTLVVTASDPNRIRREVRELSTNTPLLYKDKWDDGLFLEVVSEHLNAAKAAAESRSNSPTQRGAPDFAADAPQNWGAGETDSAEPKAS